MNKSLNMSIKCLILCFSFFIILSSTAFTQQKEYPLSPLPLSDLSNFKNPTANWQIVGEVYADRNQVGMMKSNTGAGILVNLPSESAKQDIYTSWEHGDIEIELEFMMPKGSNSGIYFQSRYELQLLDSWGKKVVKAGDCGGIYERWDESKPDGQKGYQGHPPRANASKAPGLWQSMRIEFAAPRFDATGRKISNAKFIKVFYNGVLIHENVELLGVTRGAVAEQEVAFAPLRIQGDHGAIAFRNIRYKRFDKQPLKLENLSYQCYKGLFNGLPSYDTIKVMKSDKTASMSSELVCVENDFLIRFLGEINLPETGDYYFSVQQGGISSLMIDNKVVIKANGFESWFNEQRTEIANLTAGRHTIDLAYKKNTNWIPTALGLFVEGNGIHKQPLHALGSLPFLGSEGAIFLNAEQKPRLLRSFMYFKNDKRTHVISVGESSKINYAYDVSQASILQTWRGDFLDVTGMWQDRGGSQIAAPLGNPILLFSSPTLLILENSEASWASKYNEKDQFRQKGYEIDENGRPVFKYTYQGMQVEDRIQPEEDSKFLSRELIIQTTQATNNLYAKLAEGKEIILLPDGSYGIDDKQYYVQIAEIKKTKPIIRQSGEKKELLMPISFEGNKAKIKYALVW
ncbi:MAG: DUF1080 domain-containing protein [Thermoflexibacter sp.]|nr:DUF1080 domain-containing protein [Thermoflexibacter sp.]